MTNRRSIIKSLKILVPEYMGRKYFGDLNRWIDIAMDKNLWDYLWNCETKPKNPVLDIPEPELQS